MDGSSHLCSLVPEHDELLRFTSGATLLGNQHTADSLLSTNFFKHIQLKSNLCLAVRHSKRLSYVVGILSQGNWNSLDVIIVWNGSSFENDFWFLTLCLTVYLTSNCARYLCEGIPKLVIIISLVTPSVLDSYNKVEQYKNRPQFR